MQGILAALHKELHCDKDALRAWREERGRERMAADRERMVADRAADLTLLRKTLVPREGAPPTYARALLEAMREKGYEGSEQDLSYLLKRAFRAHPAASDLTSHLPPLSAQLVLGSDLDPASTDDLRGVVVHSLAPDGFVIAGIQQTETPPPPLPDEPTAAGGGPAGTGARGREARPRPADGRRAGAREPDR